MSAVYQPGAVYIEEEGRQMGLENRVRVQRQVGAAPDQSADVVLHSCYAMIWTFPVLHCRIWALWHGYGWVPILSGG